MEKDNKLKKVGIENRMCYFNGVIKIEDFGFNDILLCY